MKQVNKGKRVLRLNFVRNLEPDGPDDLGRVVPEYLVEWKNVTLLRDTRHGQVLNTNTQSN